MCSTTTIPLHQFPPRATVLPGMFLETIHNGKQPPPMFGSECIGNCNFIIVRVDGVSVDCIRVTMTKCFPKQSRKRKSMWQDLRTSFSGFAPSYNPETRQLVEQAKNILRQMKDNKSDDRFDDTFLKIIAQLKDDNQTNAVSEIFSVLGSNLMEMFTESEEKKLTDTIRADIKEFQNTPALYAREVVEPSIKGDLKKLKSINRTSYRKWNKEYLKVFLRSTGGNDDDDGNDNSNEIDKTSDGVVEHRNSADNKEHTTMIRIKQIMKDLTSRYAQAASDMAKIRVKPDLQSCIKYVTLEKNIKQLEDEAHKKISSLPNTKTRTEMSNYLSQEKRKYSDVVARTKKQMETERTKNEDHFKKYIEDDLADIKEKAEAFADCLKENLADHSQETESRLKNAKEELNGTVIYVTEYQIRDQDKQAFETWETQMYYDLYMKLAESEGEYEEVEEDDDSRFQCAEFLFDTIKSLYKMIDMEKNKPSPDQKKLLTLYNKINKATAELDEIINKITDSDKKQTLKEMRNNIIRGE